MVPNRVMACAVFLFIFQVTAPAQEMLGTALGNYAGINGLQLNPSALHNSKSYLEVQLFGIDVFFQNNYLYMDKADYRFSNFFKSGYVWPTHNEDYGVEQRNFYHYTNTKNKNAFVQERINGPGAMLIWGHHAFAINTAVRTVVSGVRVPYELANFIYLGLNYTPQQNINYADKGPIKASGMSWGEIGLAYSNTFYARGFNVLSAGITVKRLLGLGGMYMNARNLDYIVPDDSTIDIKNVDAEIGLSLPVNYATNTAMTSPLFKGGGFGIDLGVTYTRLTRHHQDDYFNSLCAQPYEDYLYRVGVALIDVGGITFNHNATKMRIDNQSSYWENVPSLKFRSIQQFLDTLSYQFYGDNTSAYAGDKFTLWLPSALSAQFDYHFKEQWYVNASLILGFPLSRAAVARPAEIAITPRYETRWFEASMPVSLYNWQLVRMGLAVRIYALTIGTDKIGGFFHFSDFTGLDFYMSLKLFFNKGNCRNKGPVHCGSIEPKKIKY
jgi:hypothetical protein